MVLTSACSGGARSALLSLARGSRVAVCARVRAAYATPARMQCAASLSVSSLSLARGFSSDVKAAKSDEELEVDPVVERVIQLLHSSGKHIHTHRKKKLMDQYRRHPTDTGSAEAQIAAVTERITRLTDHLRANLRINQRLVHFKF